MLFILNVHSSSFLRSLYNFSQRLIELNVSLFYLIKQIFFPFSITIILPSEVQILLNPYSSLAYFNCAIHKEVKLSVTDVFVPLNVFLVMKTFFLMLYLVNLIIIAQHYVLHFCYYYDVFGQYQMVAYLAQDACQ